MSLFPDNPENHLLPENVQAMMRIHNTLLKSSVEISRLITDNYLEIATFLKKTLTQVASYDNAFADNLRNGETKFEMKIITFSKKNKGKNTNLLLFLLLAVNIMQKIAVCKKDIEQITKSTATRGIQRLFFTT